MTINKIKEINFLSKFICSSFGHRIIRTRTITNHFKEYKCSICSSEFTTDPKGHKTFLTPELREINEELFSLHQKRHISI